MPYDDCMSKTTVTSETALFASQLLGRLARGPMTIGAAGSPHATPLPPPIADLFEQILSKLATGHAVAVTEQREELTPNEAASILNVSRPYVLKLLEDGTLPYRMVGIHHRIPYADVIAHKREQRARSRKAMTELVQLSEDMGLYDAPQPMPSKADYREPPESNKPSISRIFLPRN